MVLWGLVSSIVITSKATISLGFNAKANVDPEIQLVQVKRALGTLSPRICANMTIRVSGGTRSQIDFPKDWKESTITGWINLQKEFRFGLSYTVNGNDTPESQRRFIQTWQQRGAKFSFIELMNEYYLAKYRDGKPNGKDVTRRVTAKDYVENIVPTWIKGLAPTNAKLYIIVAPQRQEGGKSSALADWNKVVIGALNSSLKNFQLGVAVHLYQNVGSPFDYGQLANLRSRLPAGTPIAVTEAGVHGAKSEVENAKLESDHLRKIASQLKGGDSLMDQILYKPSPTDYEGCISNKGVTTKGRSVLALYAELN